MHKDVINLCEFDNTEVHQTLVNKIIADENLMPTKLDELIVVLPVCKYERQ